MTFTAVALVSSMAEMRASSASPERDGAASDGPLPMAHGRAIVAFLDAIGYDQPVIVIGHGFAAGVATKFAHDHAADIFVIDGEIDTAALERRLSERRCSFPALGRVRSWLPDRGRSPGRRPD